MTDILIVEDESIVAWDIKETLEKLGHQVVDLVASGAEAIRAATNSHPELVLMDIRLAGDMDGITAGAEIYDRLNIPVVYLTAHADEHTLERATQTNPFGYIIKPFQWQTLQSTIKVAIQRHRTELATSLNRVGLTRILNSIGNGIIITDRQGVVTFINPMGQDLIGWRATEALGKQIGEIFRLHWESDGIAIENPAMRAMRLQQVVKSPDRCWLATKYGSDIPLADTATPIYQPDGRVIGSIVIFHNNSDRLNAEMDLIERNQDLEDFQLKLICQLQLETTKYQQAIACVEVLNTVFDRVSTATTETELLQGAIQQLGMALDADYCWCTLHQSQDSTAIIVSEYINTEHQSYPTSNVGQKIDLLLYPQFYDRLFDRKSWIDPPVEIVPKPYLDLLDPIAQTIVCPMLAAPPRSAIRRDRIDDWAIGEVGIVITGKPLWTSYQARLISKIFSYAIQFFRQTHRESLDRKSISQSLTWLDSIKDEFRMSLLDVNRAMYLSAEVLIEQIRSFELKTANLAQIEQNQLWHQKLTVNLQSIEAEWQRQFHLIDTLIDIQTNGITYHLRSLSDLEFDRWTATIAKRCAALAQRYRHEMSERIPNDRLPLKLIYPARILELIVVEMFENACKYTPQDRLISLAIDIRANRLQVRIVSVGIELSTRDIELIFSPFARDSRDAAASGITGLGLPLIGKLVPLLGGEIQASSDRDGTSLILTVPIA
ncbi:response regulator [Chamaesiphon polymorphus]|uniref:histidine kinase n=1 Tax=Chamaesiphon polymorphus CCALA 037 TaxID=2107692 RepID=A0A2T1GBK6_9CYAN|nr:response regulator [Chamaesiphon polymorphus]PSB54633.1 hypothetical protein C7B77_17575 [Chamaesiphon polymorphus CCALA 037]